MPTSSYSVAGVPLAIAGGNYTDFTVNVTDNLVIDSMSCDVNITSPDEGSGPDATYLVLELYDPLSSGVTVLQSADPASLAGINFEGGRAAVPPGYAPFIGIQANGIWTFRVLNFAASDGTLNSFTLNLTYTAPPTVVRYPTAPAAITIPAGIKYGVGGSLNKNLKFLFNAAGLNVGPVLESAKMVPFNAKLEGMDLCIKNSGSAFTTKLNLHRFRNRVDTILVTEQFNVAPGVNYYFRQYPIKSVQIDNVDISCDRTLLEGDILFFSVEQAGTGLASLTAGIKITQRN